VGGIVLQNLSKEIRECYENAERCEACARQAVNPEIKNDLSGNGETMAVIGT
jgi:hypothetical protein